MASNLKDITDRIRLDLYSKQMKRTHAEKIHWSLCSGVFEELIAGRS